MLDFNPPELIICAVIAVLVIGPKELPKAMRVVGYWVGRARGVARHFRTGFDAMVREAELEELEKKWAAENERIKKEFPFDETLSLDAPRADEAVMTPLSHSPVDLDKPALGDVEGSAPTPPAPTGTQDAKPAR